MAAGVAKLHGIFARLAQLAAGGALPAATGTAVLEFVRTRFADDIKKNFTESRSPELVPYKPLKWRSGTPLILTRALMRAATESLKSAEWSGSGRLAFGMSGTPKYWSYHNYGTRRIPQRRFYFPRRTTLDELAKIVSESFAFEIIHKPAQGT